MSHIDNDCAICDALELHKVAKESRIYVHQILEANLAIGNIFSHARNAGAELPSEAAISAMLDTVYADGDDEEDPEMQPTQGRLQ